MRVHLEHAAAGAGAGMTDATLALSPRLMQATLREAAAAAPAGPPGLAPLPLLLTSAAANAKVASSLPAKPDVAPLATTLAASAAVQAAVAATSTPVVATIAIRLASPRAPPPAAAGSDEANRAPELVATAQPLGISGGKPSIEDFPTPQRKSVLKLRASAVAAGGARAHVSRVPPSSRCRLAPDTLSVPRACRTTWTR